MDNAYVATAISSLTSTEPGTAMRQVVALQIDQHDVLGTFFRGFQQAFFQRRIFDRIG